MHPGLRNGRKRESHSYPRQLYCKKSYIVRLAWVDIKRSIFISSRTLFCNYICQLQTFESKGLRKMSSWSTSSFLLLSTPKRVLDKVTASTLVTSSTLLLLGSGHWKIVGSVRQSIRYHGSGWQDGKAMALWWTLWTVTSDIQMSL